MEYRNLGNSGLKVSEVGLGSNNFGWWADEKTSAVVIDQALEDGINFIDTADGYGAGQSEEFLGRALKGKRANVILATKFASPMGKGANDKGGSRYHIMQAVEASLKRLQTDYIDLYQMHFPDTSTPIEETLRAMDDLVRSGKVRYIGCSNFAGWQLADALWTSRACNLNSFVTVQSQYNLLSRDIEKELVPCCTAHGIGVIPYSPLANGFLTGKYKKGEEPPADARLAMDVPFFKGVLNNDTNWEKLAKYEKYAGEHGHTMLELTFAWLLSRPWLSTVIAGARKPEQITANVAAAAWKLSADEVAELDAI